MAGMTPDLQLPTYIAARLWPVPNYTAWQQEHVHESYVWFPAFVFVHPQPYLRVPFQKYIRIMFIHKNSVRIP